MNIFLLQIQQVSNQAGLHKSSEELVKHDPYGLFLSVVSIIIVMSVLLIVYFAFKGVNNLIKYYKHKKTIGEVLTDTSKISNSDEKLSGEVAAAIALAMSLYYKEIQDTEDSVLTIKKIAHRYSPWSSKIYAMRNLP